MITKLETSLITFYVNNGLICRNAKLERVFDLELYKDEYNFIARDCDDVIVGWDVGCFKDYWLRTLLPPDLDSNKCCTFSGTYCSVKKTDDGWVAIPEERVHIPIFE